MSGWEVCLWKLSVCVRSLNCGCKLLGIKGGCGYLNLVQMQPGVWKSYSLLENTKLNVIEVYFMEN